MKSKHLLLTLLLALFVPWAANAQTLTVHDASGTNKYVPFYGYYADNDQTNQMIYPATELADMNGKAITEMVFYWQEGNDYGNDYGVGTWTVSLGETTATTLSGLDNTTSLTPVFTGVLDEAGGLFDNTAYTLTIAFDDQYVYGGGNLLVQFSHTETGEYEYYVFEGESVTGASYCYGSQRNFLPKTTFSYSTPSSCPKPKNLTCTAYTTNTATFTWTNGGEETQWLLEYATDENFTNPTQVTVNQSDLVNGAYTLDNNLTTDQQYYARIKAYCPSCDPNYSDWSNTCAFKPSNTHYAVIGTGQNYTSGGIYGGIYTYNNYYAYTQQIYTATELTNAGAIPGVMQEIALMYAETTASKLTFEVYLGQTTATSLSSAWISDADLTKVYEGETTFSGNAEWNSIDVTTITEWEWDATSNIVVAIPRTDKTSPAVSYPDFYYTSISSMCRYIYSSSSNVSLNDSNVPSSGTGYTTMQRPDMQFGIAPNPTPKPLNLHVVNGSLWSGGATLAWEAPSSATPTSYEYCYKTDASAWSAWESTPELSVDLNLSSSTHYTFQVKAIYDGVGESAAVETDFTTLDDCAFPTNLTATTTPGQGTKATLTWVKGYDETAWVLEYATNNTFTEGLVEVTDGFTVEGNNVTANLTGLTAETHYYARVKANCDGPTSSPSNVAEFTVTNYVDYTFNEDATSNSSYSYIPFRGSYVAYQTNSQFIIPQTSLGDLAGGTVKKLTFYSTSTYANVAWGDASFKVYVAEVDNTTFASDPTSLDWSAMEEVYSGSLSVVNSQMVIELDQEFTYSGTKNLMIGFEKTAVGTNAAVAWIYKSASNTCAYSYNSSSATGELSYGRSGYLPKMTFNYRPTPYVKIAAINEGTIAATSAELTWTAPETTATITGYAYQYKLSSAAEWPTAWSNLAASATSVTLQPLTPGTSYDFQIKVLYGEHESAVNSTSFFTECAIVTAFPWKEDFEAYATGDFSHPCWVNQHISGDGDKIFKVYTSANGTNSTHQLQLPDQDEGTLTKLRLPEMNLPNNNYQFVIDVYRSNSTYAVDLNPYEGIRVYASTDGNIDDATPLAFIPRQYDEENGSIPAEDESGWYTYELPIGIQGTCFIILRGESQYCTSTYMDNLTVEQIPTCARPKDLAYSNVTNHSAKLSWTAGDTGQTLWQIAYSKTTFDPNTASFDITTVTTIDATGNPFTLDKILDAASTYCVYVRANCGTATEPDYGPWCRKGVSLTTLAAAPAPSNFVASNPASAKIDLVWNAGGGDFESWELYYVASETAPEAPTATTAALKTVTTLPTTEAPYVLDGLNPVTKYYAWVRAKHVWNSEATYSDWVALTGNYFETLDACPTPTGLTASNLTSVSADLSWVGSDDVTEGYTVEYGEEGSYSVNETEDFSGLTTAGYSSEGVLPEGWMRYNSNPGYMPHVSDASACGDINEFGTGNNYLLMTQNKSSNQYLYAIMPQISDLASLEFKYVYESTGTGVLSVGYVTDNTGYSTYQVLQTPTKSGTIATCKLTATDIATINANNGYVTFRYEGTSGTYYSVGIDDIVYKGGTYTPGATQTVPSEGTSITISNLTPNKTYIVKVKSNCTSGEYCEPISFTTLAAGNMVFTNATNDGKWGTAGNWAPAQLPVSTDEVILRANATIENTCVAEAKKINLNSNTLTIADGGQLITNTAVNATVQKSIAAYTEDGGWYFISSPINSSYYNVTSTGLGLITDNLGSNATPETATYDLYRFVQNPTLDQEGIGKEWQNYRNTSFTYFDKGKGYLYANKNDITLNFTGSIKPVTENGSISLTYAAESTTQDMKFRGWNLVGNPFTFNTYVNMSYYKMNEDGSTVVPVDAYQTTAIAPCTGIMVQATESDQSVTFSKEAPSSQTGNQGNLNIALAQANVRNNSIMDKAILSFNEGSQLSKFYFGQNKANIYFPQDNEPLAIVSSEGQGEMPLNFKAYENGSYTLSFGSQNASFNYLRLIDNLTGAEVDLLQTPSYTFNATTTDYESRFKLVFCTGVNDDSDSFAFCSNGNWIINNDGEAILQVIDVTGRILSSETVNGSVSKAIHAAPGVYMLRLINGDNVKVQKVVVR